MVPIGITAEKDFLIGASAPDRNVCHAGCQLLAVAGLMTAQLWFCR